MQVEDGKPSDNLVRYLSKDVEGLTLEYQTDLLTYYIIPNISKALLFKKSCFMEKNMTMLGLVNFEFISLPVFEMAARDIPSVIPEVAIKDYEESVEEQEFAHQSPRGRKSTGTKIYPADNLKLNLENKGCENLQSVENEQDINQDELSQESSDLETEDREMTEFRGSMQEPLKRPKYRRDLFYDFRKHRARARPWYLQAIFIFVRFWLEHWNKKLRFIAIAVLPSMLVYSGWHSARYFKNFESESLELTPQMYQPYSKLIVNNRTMVGDLDTSRWIEKLPQFDQDAFKVDYVDTSDAKFNMSKRFNQMIF